MLSCVEGAGDPSARDRPMRHTATCPGRSMANRRVASGSSRSRSGWSGAVWW